MPAWRQEDSNRANQIKYLETRLSCHAGFQIVPPGIETSPLKLCRMQCWSTQKDIDGI